MSPLILSMKTIDDTLSNGFPGAHGPHCDDTTGFDHHLNDFFDDEWTPAIGSVRKLGTKWRALVFCQTVTQDTSTHIG